MNRLLAKYLFNEATPRERARVQRWLERDPRHRQELQRLRDRLDLATRHYQPGTFDTRAALARVAPRATTTRRLPRRLTVAAAAILLLLGATWFFFPRTPSPVTLSAAPGEIRTYLLPDSTRVTLSGPATLRHGPDFNEKTRDVQATGTLYLEVHADPHRPFTVTTAWLSARVLGTAFQVESDDTRAEVLVKEGRVQVSAPSATAPSLLLTAGMSATRLAGHPDIALHPAFDANRLAWKTGDFYFRDTPLPEVISLLQRHFRVTIPLPPALANERLTATFLHPTLPVALDIINQTLGTSLSPE